MTWKPTVQVSRFSIQRAIGFGAWGFSGCMEFIEFVGFVGRLYGLQLRI